MFTTIRSKMSYSREGSVIKFVYGCEDISRERSFSVKLWREVVWNWAHYDSWRHVLVIFMRWRIEHVINESTISLAWKELLSEKVYTQIDKFVTFAFFIYFKWIHIDIVAYVFLECVTCGRNVCDQYLAFIIIIVWWSMNVTDCDRLPVSVT